MREMIGTFKSEAVQSLKGKWGSSAVLVLVAGVLGMAFSYFLYGIPSILLLPMSWGVAVAFLEVSRGNDPDLGWLTRGYSRFSEVFLTMLLRQVYVGLWTLLLIVPGIVKTYSYAMTPYILQDDPDCKYDAAICRSMELMHGHKMDLFLLDLSFIGWVILCLLTLGIGFLFFTPYWHTARAKFYEELVAQENGNGIEFAKV